MVTHVSCKTPDCSNYGIVKTVVSAEILRMDSTVCPVCRGPMKIERTINTSEKSGGMKRHVTQRYDKRQSKGHQSKKRQSKRG
jgi:hypothetical protein